MMIEPEDIVFDLSNTYRGYHVLTLRVENQEKSIKMARAKNNFKPRRSKKSGIKTSKRLKNNHQILKKVSSSRFKVSSSAT